MSFANFVHALQYARHSGIQVIAVVGRDGGLAPRAAKACVIVPTVNPEKITREPGVRSR